MDESAAGKALPIILQKLTGQAGPEESISNELCLGRIKEIQKGLPENCR